MYMRFYRDDRTKWVNRFAALRAVASSGSIALWALWRDYAFVWAAIIAASQVGDALKHRFPFIRDQKAASEYMLALDRLLIDAELEWENVFIALDNQDILKRRSRLGSLRYEAEGRSFPNGLPARNNLLYARAEQEASAYLAQLYGMEIS